MKYALAITVLFFSVIFLSACSGTSMSEKDKATETADSFATAFYNFNYDKALALCDSDSRKRIYFITGSLNEKDIEVIRQATERASVTIKETDFNDEDSTALVTFTVNNFFKKDSIGKTGHFVETATYSLPLQKEKGHWRVRFKDMITTGE